MREMATGRFDSADVGLRPTQGNEGVNMDPKRKTAVVAGVFFIVAAVAAIIGLALYGPVLNNVNYIVSVPGNDTSVLAGAFFEVLVVIAVIGTAVALFPIVRKQNEGIALGYVAGRVVEGVVIAVGILSLVTVVTLRQDYAGATGANAATLVLVGKAFVTLHNWTFLFGPNVALGVNTLMLAYLMYRSQLVPRFIALIGLIGGPLIFASGMAVLFGLYQQVSLWGAITAIPVFAWEMSLAAWLIAKGFRPASLIQVSEG